MSGRRDKSETSLFSPERIENLQISDPPSVYFKKKTKNQNQEKIKVLL